VLAAAGNDSQAAREALSSLCQTYWYPLYAYLAAEVSTRMMRVT